MAGVNREEKKGGVWEEIVAGEVGKRELEWKVVGVRLVDWVVNV